ncbi:hypothetical protein THAOC_30569, partial [Thalassiosira oceanica]
DFVGVRLAGRRQGLDRSSCLSPGRGLANRLRWRREGSGHERRDGFGGGLSVTQGRAELDDFEREAPELGLQPIEPPP